MTLILAVLFVILSPDVLFSLPTYATPVTRAVVHSIIFVVLYNIIYKITSVVTERFIDVTLDVSGTPPPDPSKVIGPSKIEGSGAGIVQARKSDVSDDTKCKVSKEQLEQFSAAYNKDKSPINKRLMDMAFAGVVANC